MVVFLETLEPPDQALARTMTNGSIPPLLLTVAETAIVLRLGRTKVYELIATHQLPALHLGRAVRVPLEPLRAWVKVQLESECL